jgi:uncharacterized membrane protein
MPDLMTPANLSHLHLLINHFPTVGLIIAFLLLVVSIVSGSDPASDNTMKPTALGVLFGIAVITLPVFTTGLAAEGAIEKLPGISQAAMNAHEDSALLAFIVLEAAGLAAWLGLWRWRRTRRVPPSLTFATFVLAALSLGLMTVAANIGGAIRHPEILGDPKAEVARSMFSVSTAGVAFFVNGPGHQWVWPALESAHFVGMTLWFGVLLLANLRLMGWFTAIPVSGAASPAAVGAARLWRQRDQRNDVLSRHAKGLHDKRDVLLEADVPAAGRRGSALPDRLARGVEDRARNGHPRARARDWRIRAGQLRSRHVLRPHAAIPRELLLVARGS